MSFDPQFFGLTGVVVGLLVPATGIGWALEQHVVSPSAQATVANMNARIRSWWVMCVVFVASLLTGGTTTILLFGAASFLALREFLTLAPTRHGDYASLVCAFYVITPLQYALISMETHWLFSTLIPLYAPLVIPLFAIMTGEYEDFIRRAASIQWGLAICVYGLSHAPALLALEIPGNEGQNSRLLFFLVLVVEISDVLQYVWGKQYGKTKLASRISPNKTWEGAIGGVGCATLIGACVWWATPFTPLQATVISLVTTSAGLAGGMVMSAVKRERGMKDFGSLIAGHGGVLDRMDSLCFAAPVFYYLTCRLLT